MTLLERRDLLKLLASAAAGFALNEKVAHGLNREMAPDGVDRPASEVHPGAPVAVKNRAPLAPNAFDMLPLGSVRPAGWLRRQLEIQATGLGGHLDETWADVGSNSGWLGGTGESWERGPYFLDGLVPLAYLLDDDRLKAKAQRYIDWTLTHQAANGMIGPASNDDWWPRMVMLKVLMQYEEATGDPRVIPLMTRYFEHQLEALPTRPLRDWGKFRWQDNALAVIWLYNRTGDPEAGRPRCGCCTSRALIGRRTLPISNTRSASRRRSSSWAKHNGLGDYALATHGVNNGQALKAAPVWSVITGARRPPRAVSRC